MNDREIEFARKVRLALDESAAGIEPAVLNRLGAARKLALSRRRVAAPVSAMVFRPALAGVGGSSHGSGGEPFGWLQRLGLVLPLLALLAGLVGIYQWNQSERIAEIADIDTAVLVDDLPLNAYLDKGFGQYLIKRGDE